MTEASTFPKVMVVDDVLTIVLAANPEFAVQQLGDGAVVLDKTTGDCFELNRTGAEALTILAQGKDGREVISTLTSRHDVAVERVEADLRGLLADLLRRRILIPKPAVGAAKDA